MKDFFRGAPRYQETLSQNRHSVRDAAKVADFPDRKSIQKVWTNPILIDEPGAILAGSRR
jgi:hypothetical protein